MRHPNKNIALTGIVACILASCVKAPTSSEPLLSKQADFCNLINIKNTPAGAVDWDAYVLPTKVLGWHTHCPTTKTVAMPVLSWDLWS